MKKFFNLFSKALYGIFILLLVAVVALFLAPTLSIKSSVLVKIVKSGSMEPDIKTGSIVVIKSANAYAVGDVITFGEDTPTNYPTTHRIVSIKEVNGETFYEVKGDANEEADPSLTNKRDVIGKVIFTLPNAGYVLDFARQPIGFILLIAFPAVLVILNEIVDLTKEIRRTLRRKKDGQDDSDGDITIERVLERSSRMDDVFRPIQLVHRTRSKKRRDPLIASVLIFFVGGLMFTRTGATSSYFADNEYSQGNTMSAMSFEISATALPTESYVGHTGGSSVISIITPNPVGLPNEYKVSVEKIAGSDTFCQALVLSSTSTPPFVYQGPLLQFLSPPTTFAGEWSFEVELAPDASSINTEDECAINLIYFASTWLEDKNIHAGYSDVEKVTLIFKASEYDVEETQNHNLNSLLISTEEQVEETTSTTTEESIEESITDEEATSTPPLVEESEEVVEEEYVEPEVIEEVTEEIVDEVVEEIAVEESIEESEVVVDQSTE